MKDILTVPDLCAITGKSVSAIYRLARAGKIPGTRKFGKTFHFSREKIEKHFGCTLTNIPEAAKTVAA